MKTIETWYLFLVICLCYGFILSLVKMLFPEFVFIQLWKCLVMYDNEFETKGQYWITSTPFIWCLFLESYVEYFTTPYFVFLRDTLSYLALLALHFALCLETSSIPFSGLEWAIFIFFLGRFLMEIQQILGQKRDVGTRQLKRSKDERDAEKEDETEHQITDKERKVVTFVLKKCNKYLRYN